MLYSNTNQASTIQSATYSKQWREKFVRTDKQQKKCKQLILALNSS